jgi:hypothetical protein
VYRRASVGLQNVPRYLHRRREVRAQTSAAFFARYTPTDFSLPEPKEGDEEEVEGGAVGAAAAAAAAGLVINRDGDVLTSVTAGNAVHDTDPLRLG